MNILFINALFKADYSALDVAITTLATKINESKNHRAFIADTTFHQKDWKEYLIKKIENTNPKIFAFSCNNLYMQYVAKISLFLKKRYPDIPIIGGGYYTSIYPEEAIKKSFFNGIIIGDGEYTLLEILNKYEKNKKLPKKVDGFWVKDGSKTIKNNSGKFITDLSNTPHLDWDLWDDLDKYLYFLQMIYFVGSRGCPYNCSFCEACEIEDHVKGKYYRKIDPEWFAEEISFQWNKYKKRGMKLAQIFDPVFTLDKNWLKRFTIRYNELLDPKKHPISVFSRIDNLDEEKIDLLAKAGCKIIRMGIESGDDFVRNKIHNKRISTKEILKINRLLDSKKINKTLYYIIGSPTEDKNKINKTIKLAKRLNASRSAFFIYKPITKKSMKILGETNTTLNLKRANHVDNLQYGAVIENKQISFKEIEFLHAKAYLITVLPKIIKMIKKQKLSYFTRLITYTYKGLKEGQSLKYIIPYYHIYGYDNITE
ncbi:B12-binding domain-containing radical SAM protein [Candidatus Woesearchaeota archaeon]|nr:B12-binding domain-containing radical SAM protein [Candidatus Woesearchaeota archaeon]